MPIKLEIVFDPTTQKLSLNGPIDNKILCYGMLESARDIIKDFKTQVQVAPASALVDLKR